MKISSDEQRDIIKQMVYDIIEQDPLDYSGLNVDPDDILDKAFKGSVLTFENITENEELTVTQQNAVILAVITKLVMENTLLWTRIKIISGE